MLILFKWIALLISALLINMWRPCKHFVQQRFRSQLNADLEFFEGFFMTAGWFKKNAILHLLGTDLYSCPHHNDLSKVSIINPDTGILLNQWTRRWCQRTLQLWQREEESDCFCFELWIMQSRFKLKSLNHFSGTFRSPVIWNNMDMLQSYCRLKAHSLCPTIKSQHVILWNSRAGWGQGWHVSASDTPFA